MSIEATPPPSLKTLSLEALARTLDVEIAAFHMACAVSTESKYSFASKKIKYKLVKSNLDPLDKYVTKCPSLLLSEIPQPFLLSRLIQKEGRSEKTDQIWANIFHRYIPHIGPKPHELSWEQAFYCLYFENQFVSAYGDFSSLPPEVQALYIENRSEIQALHFTRCALIRNSHLENLSELYPSLRYLHLECCHLIGKATIERVLRQHPELEHLHLIGQTSLDDTSLYAAATQCKKLKTLVLESLHHKISKPALLALIQNNPDLEKIELGHFDCLDDETLAELIRSCPKLRLCIVKNCSKVTTGIFERIEHTGLYTELINCSHT